MSPDARPTNPAQRALMRMLHVLLVDAPTSKKVIADALRAARREKAPDDPWELLRWVKGDLAAELKKLVAPRFVLALIDDLAKEIDRGVNERHRSVGATVGEDADPILLRANDPAPSVVLVDSDRLARASLARALVNAQFDVRVLDTTTQVLGALRDRHGVVIVILDVKALEIEAIEALVEACPGLRVIARTGATPRVAQSVLTAAGVGAFSTVPKGAPSAHVVESARKLLGAPSSNDPPRKRDGSAPSKSRGRSRSKP